MTISAAPQRNPFLLGVFLITMSALLFQIVQTRICPLSPGTTSPFLLSALPCSA